MKRRSRKSRQGFGTQLRKPLGLLNIGKAHKRKSWMFEHLEDRLVFSTTTAAHYDAGVQLQTTSYGNDTPEGAFQTWLDEIEWTAVQTAVSNGLPAPDYLIMSLPNDPLFTSQWNLLNTGQETGNPDLQPLFGVAGEDIDVVPAWNMGVTGAGVTVAVIDTGVQLTHPDLIANISPTLRYNAENGTSNVSPNLGDQDSGHGTSVAGIIGATGNNSLGITGIAPNVTIVPIKIGITEADQGPTNPNIDQFFNAFEYALQHDVDITNNSWGPSTRTTVPLTAKQAEVLRDSAIFGRDGLGMINVFASGNDGGPAFSAGFQTVGDYSSTSYNQWANSRYVITVGGTDENGMYANPDGTFTSYPEIGPNVLVSAPTGSTGALNITSDTGYGSGIWTTDLTGANGFNAAPLPGGIDTDNDPLQDPDYTSRFNGTSAAAPEVSAVIALMLQANPDLTYRDVQEILVRSARQNGEFETPTSGQLIGPRTTWQVNQIGPFREPDPWYDQLLYPLPILQNPVQAIADPLADPGLEGFGSGQYSVDSNDGDRQVDSRYESEPPQYTNGAGYTVSQGYGVYAEQTGYGHGVVDAGLAVEMASEWSTLGQNIAPNTEKTFTTSVIDNGSALINLPAAEKMTDENGGMIVPGGIGGRAGFIAYWNEFFKPVTITNGVPDPKTGPFSEDKPPVDTRGDSYLDFNVPPPQQIDVEWVEVRVDLKGPAADLNNLRIMLASPEGTQSDFNEYFAGNFTGVISFQPVSTPGNAGNEVWLGNPAGQALVNTDEFVWTFATNRDWGETTNSAVVMDPVTGEPILGADGFPIFRDWELHLENWGQSALGIAGVEVVWHGKAISGGTLDPSYGLEGVSSAQRVQGFVGIDTNGDNQFDYNRYLQGVADPDGDPSTTRLLDVQRDLDYTDNNHNGIYDAGDVINQEPFAANVIVDAYRAWDGVPESSPVDRFLTGADGNYYFDLDVQGDLAQTTTIGSPHFGQKLTYQIKATDPLGRTELEDIDTPAQTTSDPALTYLPHYKQVWTITPDWFYAPDRDNTNGLTNNPGEILYDPATGAPVPFTNNGSIPRVPMAVKDLNFLLKQDAPAQTFDVTGTVYSDLNGDGKFNGTDTTAPGIQVYWDKNRNGVLDGGETTVTTDANGKYVLPIDLTTLPILPSAPSTYQIGVVKPNGNWKYTDPGKDGVETVFAGAGFGTQTVNFFLQPPNNGSPSGGLGPGSIYGFVFSDLNKNGVQDPNEPGLPNFRVFIDQNGNGVWDSATEPSVITNSGGGFVFTNVTPGSFRIDIVIPNEGTADAAWSFTTPLSGFQQVTLGSGGTVTGIFFGLQNLADRDWGDLPNSYGTTAAVNGPSNKVVAGFQLGPTNDGDVNGKPTPDASGDDGDDGVFVVSNGGVLERGVNTLQVTVQGIGGLLTGWMDFNDDGHFDATEKLTWSLNGTSLGSEADLNPGTYNLQIAIPANAVLGPIAARFRWGEAGLSFLGPAQIGETEDYFFGLNYIYGDYNRDGKVDLGDYNVWRKQNGSNVAPYTGADGNGDGVVNGADYDIWRNHFGQSLPQPGAGAGALVAESSSSTGGTLSGVGTGLGAGAIAVGPGLPSVGSSVSSSVSSGGVQSATIASGSSSSSLLLMDLAIGDIDSSSYHATSTDDLVDSNAGHDDSHPNDLALASVLDSDLNTWNAF